MEEPHIFREAHLYVFMTTISFVCQFNFVVVSYFVPKAVALLKKWSLKEKAKTKTNK